MAKNRHIIISMIIGIIIGAIIGSIVVFQEDSEYTFKKFGIAVIHAIVSGVIFAVLTKIFL